MDEVWDIVYDNELDGDLYAVSIVDRPANQLKFIALSEIKENYQIKLGADNKRKILYGIVLRADQKIYREKENGDPFYIKFSADTIVKLSQDFFKKGYQNNSTFNHNSEETLESSTIVENWIVENKEMDKSTHLGLKSEVGDWVVGMKISDEKEWDEYVETGKAKGFSIDSFLKLKKIKLKEENGDYYQKSKNEKSSEKMSVLKNFMKLFSSVNLAEVVVDGKTLTADEFVEGNVVYDENLEPFVGEFEWESKTVTTNTEGLIISVADMEMETEEVEVEVEEMKEELKSTELKEESKIDEKEEIVELKDETKIELELRLEELKTKNETINELESKIELLNKELDGFKSKPLVDNLKASPINMTKIEVSKSSALATIERLTKNNV